MELDKNFNNNPTILTMPLKNKVKNKIYNSSEPIIIFIHGIHENSKVFAQYDTYFQTQGYKTCLIDYYSTKYNIKDSVKQVYETINEKIPDITDFKEVYIIAHSMGAIISYFLINDYKLKPKSSIFLGPPLLGSQLAKFYARPPFKFLFKAIYGQAGLELITKSSLIAKIKQLNFPVGIIAGNRKTWGFNGFLIKGINDGKVAIEETILKGFLDHIILPVDHHSMLQDKNSMEQCLHFLKNNSFYRKYLRL
ncbi:Alpha/beta hydrolase family protein [Candidatus Hepatincolaceae symbiont of Richtersius coronifer]